MEVIETGISDLVVLVPKVFGDARGYFTESFNADVMEKAGLPTSFVQDNQSFSKYGTIRGLHFQTGEFAQTKLLRCTQGRILDVAVDIRKDSPTFGKYFAVELTDENFKQLLVPAGFAHGFAVLSETAIVQYKCDKLYSPENESGLLFSDPDLAIDWQIPEDKRILSEKDQKLPLLKDISP